jgi:hypothetical protein
MLEKIKSLLPNFIFFALLKILMLENFWRFENFYAAQ